MLKKLLKDIAGSTAIEYAIIASVISVAATGAFLLLGEQSSTQMNTVQERYAEVN